MSFQTPAPQPEQPTTPEPAPQAVPDAPAAPASQPAAGAPNEPTPSVHPAWNKALENIPEAWRGPIIEQARQSEIEHQRAIEQARQGSVPEDWRGLYSEAQQLGLTPQQLVEAYNGQQQLYDAMVNDPDGFLADISAQIDQAVAQGLITRKEGAQAKQDAAGAVDDLLTPEQKDLAELKAWRDQQEQAAQQYQTQAQQEQVAQIAESEAMAFVDAVHSAFDNDPQLAGATAQTRQIAAQVASGLIDADQTGQLTYDQAIGAALNQLREALGWQGAPAPQNEGQQPNLAALVGGGNPGIPQQVAPKFDMKTQEGRDQRDAWLTAQLESMNANAQH